MSSRLMTERLTRTHKAPHSRPTRAYIHTHVVLKEVRVVPLDAVVQYGHHHVFARVAPLPRPHDVHVRLAIVDVVVAVLETREQVASGEQVEGKEKHTMKGVQKTSS